MANSVEIGSVIESKRFGIIDKVRWFKTNDNYNYFDITFNVFRSQVKDTNLSIINLGGEKIWQKTIPRSADPNPLVVPDKILNSPGLQSTIYGALNTYN